MVDGKSRYVLVTGQIPAKRVPRALCYPDLEENVGAPERLDCDGHIPVEAVF